MLQNFISDCVFTVENVVCSTLFLKQRAYSVIQIPDATHLKVESVDYKSDLYVAVHSRLPSNKSMAKAPTDIPAFFLLCSAGTLACC